LGSSTQHNLVLSINKRDSVSEKGPLPSNTIKFVVKFNWLEDTGLIVKHTHPAHTHTHTYASKHIKLLNGMRNRLT
jgi:hypothetical protein